MTDQRAEERRRFLRRVAVLGALPFLPIPSLRAAPAATPVTRAIPSSGEPLPVVGLGTAYSFDIDPGGAEMAKLREVLQAFLDSGGTVIDTSPMYGAAETVLGRLLAQVDKPAAPFMATKVWTDGRDSGIAQMRRSARLLGVEVVDLMQVHNLRDWRVHLETLRRWKADGLIRYIGITTHRGYDHDELADIMATEPGIDFIQVSYSLGNRKAEERLLPLAAERGIATLINRPYQRGELFQRVRGQALPDWVAEFDCASWGQFMLKFILGHPAVTCVIPSTTKVKHLHDNMAAGHGRLPDPVQRQRMAEHFAAL